MTIEGAIVELQNLIDDDAIPFWAKPSLQKIIETVEAEREEHLWIPVAERLPEEEGEYLVTLFNETHTVSFFDGTQFWCVCEVVAWKDVGL